MLGKIANDFYLGLNCIENSGGFLLYQTFGQVKQRAGSHAAQKMRTFLFSTSSTFNGEGWC